MIHATLVLGTLALWGYYLRREFVTKARDIAAR